MFVMLVLSWLRRVTHVYYAGNVLVEESFTCLLCWHCLGGG